MNSKNNRSVRRTKASLRQAFLELAACKPVRAITINELVEASDVSRGTFYVHYHDIYELMEAIGADLLAELAQHLDEAQARMHVQGQDAGAPPPDTFPLLEPACAFACQEAQTFRVLLGAEGNEGFRRQLEDFIGTRCLAVTQQAFGTMDKAERGTFESFVTAGFLGILRDILAREEDLDPHAIAHTLGTITIGAARALVADREAFEAGSPRPCPHRP